MKREKSTRKQEKNPDPNRETDDNKKRGMPQDDHEEPCNSKDCVEEASEESFPASDPPSFTPTKGT